MREWIVGRNPVFEVIRANRRQIYRLMVSQGAQEKGRLDEILRLGAEHKVPLEKLPRQRLDTFGVDHQGVVLETDGYVYSTLFDILELAEKKKEAPFILVLDVLQDPQNLGTLLRTAECAGVHGVLLPLSHAATVTPAVVSASAGACEYLLVAQTNLAQALSQLKQSGIWVVGLEGDLEFQQPQKGHLDGPLALVVGGEGQGMRKLVRQSCDFLMALPMQGKIDSLNASVAGSIAIYFVLQARGLQPRYANPLP